MEGEEGEKEGGGGESNLILFLLFFRYGHAFMTGSLFPAGTDSLSTLTDLIEVLVN